MSYDGIPSAKITLDYPLYACEFDSKDATRLVVAGGGGASRSGVGNKITVLQSSLPTTLEKVAEIDLSKDEDSITSLAVGKTIGDTTPIYAGINSGPAAIQSGKNDHFRTFAIKDNRAKGKTTSTKITEQSRNKLFAKVDPEAYQRITRLSKPYANSSQLGVVATGMAQESEIVLFDTAYSSSGKPHVRGKIVTPDEAEDADVIQSGQDEYLFAYCTKKEVFLRKVGAASEGEDVDNIWLMPGPETQQNPPVMDFRCLRFLTPQFVLLLANLANNRGVVLQILRLPSAESDARIALQARLHNRVTKATGLAATCLTPLESYDSKPEAAQFVVAVAGHDTSVSILTFNYSFAQNMAAVADFKVRARLDNVHDLQMTSIALSDIMITEHQNVVKLATVSMVNSAVVHTVPLKTTTSDIQTPGKVRYIIDVRKPSRSPTSQLIITLFVLLIAFITQTILEVRDISPDLINAKQFVSPFYQGMIRNIPDRPVVAESVKSYADFATSAVNDAAESVSTSVSQAIPTDNPVSTVTESLNDMLQDLIKARSEGKEDHVIFIREEQGGTDVTEPASIKADLHHEATHGPHGGTTWEELSEGDQKKWLKKLKDAGHIGEDYGFTVLKGVVFGTIGQAIGAMAAR